VGTPGITEHSAKLYGRPDDRVPGATLTNLDAAHHFIAIAGEYNSGAPLDQVEAEISAETLQVELQQKLDALFGANVVRVETDPDPIAKAAAGATRIRLRSATNFSDYDRDQLLAHEAFVHTLTALNGCTATQEGLSVFAELIVWFDRHCAHEADQPAHPRHRHGDQGRGFHRGVPLLHGRGPERDRQSYLCAARVPRCTGYGRRGVHQGCGQPARFLSPYVFAGR
jgi:hypothetical protein